MTDKVDINPAVLAAEIVSAYVAKNAVPAAELPGLIISTHAALVTLVAGPVPEPAKAVPVVDPRKAVRHDAIACLHCGATFKSLRRHLGTAHGQSPAEYREAFGLSADYPVVARGYSEARSVLSKQLGLGRKPAHASVQ